MGEAIMGNGALYMEDEQWDKKLSKLLETKIPNTSEEYIPDIIFDFLLNNWKELEVIMSERD